jgi:pyruvate dehydrogenase E2 component (dihydrolipoamide acetyltransferase)
MPDVVMPRLSDSMEEGTILRWLKADGDVVRRGDELAEIETDKATMTYEAEADGVLHRVAQEGDTLAVGAVIATLGEAAAEGAAAARPEGRAEEAAPVAAEEARREAATAAAGPSAAEERPSAAPTNGTPADDGEVRASPLARRIARERGIELGTVRGSGPGGRIVKADVEGAGSEPSAAPPAPPPRPPRPPRPEPTLAETGTAKGDVHVEELTRTQQVVARRMAESKATVPDFSITTEVDMRRCVDLREQLRAVADPAPSYNDLVVKAAALALRESPRANGAYRDGRFELYSRVNVGVAVAGQDSLVVPTVFDADRKSLTDIAREARRLAERVRAGAITPPEVSGGTFTVSNLGMYGVTEFSAVINPPQAGILAVGALREVPAVRGGAIVPGHAMTLTLVCDHRILYGADAAEFLARIRALLERPLELTG